MGGTGEEVGGAVAGWGSPLAPTTPPLPPPLSQTKGVDLVLPTDVVVADKFAADANTQVVSVDAIPDGWMVSWMRWVGLGA